MGLSNYMRNVRAKVGNELLLVPGVCALIFNEKGEVLLQRRSDSGKWGLPGGMMDPGEQPADAVVREIMEETALRVVPERITGVYLTRVITYPGGDKAQYVITAFRCRAVGGEARVNDDESLEMGYFPVDALPEISADHRSRIEHARADGPTFFMPAAKAGQE